MSEDFKSKRYKIAVMSFLVNIAVILAAMFFVEKSLTEVAAVLAAPNALIIAYLGAESYRQSKNGG